MPICVHFLISPRDPLYYQILLFLSFFWTFKADLRGLFMLWKCLKNTFLLKIYPKALKNLQIYFNLYGWPRVFCHPLRPLCMGVKGGRKGHIHILRVSWWHAYQENFLPSSKSAVHFHTLWEFSVIGVIFMSILEIFPVSIKNIFPWPFWNAWYHEWEKMDKNSINVKGERKNRFCRWELKKS